MVELSPTFMQLASSKDIERLFSMLPYKTLSFSKIEGRHGIYALIDKNENGIKILKQCAPLSGRSYKQKNPQKSRKRRLKIKKSRIGGMSMIRLTVEETNLLSIYNEDGKHGLTENINAALPFMDEDMRELAKRTLRKSPL